MTPTQSKAAFVFRWFADRTFGHDDQGHYHSSICTATPTFDDGLDFVCAFDESFPGRVPDGNHVRASSRLSSLLRKLTDDGWIERWRLGNEIDLPGTPTWQFCYKLPQWLIDDLKYRRLTPEDAAKRWGG